MSVRDPWRIYGKRKRVVFFFFLIKIPRAFLLSLLLFHPTVLEIVLIELNEFLAVHRVHQRFVFLSLAQNWWRRGGSSEIKWESEVCRALIGRLKQTQIYVDLKFCVKGSSKEVVAGPFHPSQWYFIFEGDVQALSEVLVLLSVSLEQPQVLVAGTRGNCLLPFYYGIT